MSIIDPNIITNISFQGAPITGNILSVGTDGLYSYDYNHPQTAYNAASSGDIILIYPGTYTPTGSYTTLTLNRGINIYVKGMGLSPDDVVLATPDTIWHGIEVTHTNTNYLVVVENLKVTQDRAWGGAFVCRACSPSTNIRINKLNLYSTNFGYPINLGDGASTDYTGNLYVTNCDLTRGYAHTLRLGRGSTTSTISVDKSYYAGSSIFHYDNARNPSPDDYVTSSTPSYGCYYGTSFFTIFTTPSNDFTVVRALVVGGGGAGGARHGGGGGGGGVVYHPNLVIGIQRYPVIVGLGGTPDPAGYTIGGNGQNSSFDSMVALGGGGGGSYTAPVPTGGGCGGGGGGGLNRTRGLANQADIGGGYGYGRSGGDGDLTHAGGGGGGATSSGINAATDIGGAGGYGFESDISGTLVRYAGGGGGGGESGGGIGRDGGGNGGISSAMDGQGGYGGGGGGNRSLTAGTKGGYGGDGVVIISYSTGIIEASGGIITTVSGNTIHTFLVSDDFVVISDSSSRRRNIWINEPYIYRATKYGVNIYSSASEEFINYVPFLYGANAVWANDEHFYITTSTSGVCRCAVENIYGEPTFEEYKIYPNITSNSANYLHGNGDYLCVTTISGIDRYKISTDEREYTLKSNVTKCFQTSVGDFYYVVNNLPNISNLDGNIFEWSYCRVVDLSKPIPDYDYQFVFEIPMTEPDEIYLQAKQNGDDIRIISDEGIAVPYYILSWDYITPPRICAKLSMGTRRFYILYGNSKATAKSSGIDTYKFFDHFEGTTLSSNWAFNNYGSSSNYYTVYNSKIRFYSYSTLALYSTLLFKDSVLEYSFRKVPMSYDDNLGWVAGFFNGTTAYIGCINNGVSEFPHYLTSASNYGTVSGTKFASLDYKTHTVVTSNNYQMSNYDGETLVSSGTLTNPIYRVLVFTYSAENNRPDIEIDWIRIRNYDPSPPSYVVSRGNDVNDMIDITELHAVYNNGEEYIYESKRNNIINASYINDLYITENTATQEEGHTIFLATSWGAISIDEKRGDEANSDKKRYLITS